MRAPSDLCADADYFCEQRLGLLWVGGQCCQLVVGGIVDTKARDDEFVVDVLLELVDGTVRGLTDVCM